MGLATRRVPLRAVVILVTLGILCVALTAEVLQATKVHRIGRLSSGSPPTDRDPLLEAFRQGLHDLGYVEGQNLVIKWCWAEGSEERLRDLTAELVQLKADVIVAPGTAAVRAAQHATRTIPVVMTGSYDPVGEGFVASLARPGGEHHGLELPWGGAPRKAAGDPEGDGAPEHAHRRVVESGRSGL